MHIGYILMHAGALLMHAGVVLMQRFGRRCFIPTNRIGWMRMIDDGRAFFVTKPCTDTFCQNLFRMARWPQF